MTYAEPAHRSGTATRPTLHLMSTDETLPEQSTEKPTEESTEEATEKRSRLAGLRERARNVRGGMVAAVLAGVIVGGAGGFAVGAVTTGHDHGPGDRGPGMTGRPFDQDGDDHGFRPGGAPGQLPPTTAPEEESDLSNS